MTGPLVRFVLFGLLICVLTRMTATDTLEQLLGELKAWRKGVGAEMMQSNPDYGPNGGPGSRKGQ